MKKRIALLMALVMLLALTACAAKTPAETKPTAEAPESESETAQEPSAESAEPVTIEFWYQNNPTFVEFFEGIAEKFNASNDKGITVKVTGFDVAALESAITAGMMDGTAPALFYTRSNAYYSNLCGEGVLEDLTSYGLPLNDVAKAAATGADGGIYAATLGYQPICLAYNKTIFEENNIKVPTNYEELAAAIKALDAAGYGKMCYPGGTAGHVWMSRAIFHTTMGTDGYKALEEGIDNGTITALPEDAVAALESISGFNSLLYNGADAMTNDVQYTLATTGEAAMLFMQPANLIVLDLFADVDMGIIPVFAPSTNNQFYGEITCMMSMWAGADDAQKAAAAEFLKFVFTNENMTTYCDITVDMAGIDGVVPTHGTELIDTVNQYGMTLRSLPNTSMSEYWKNELDTMLMDILFKGADVSGEVEKFNAHLVDADIASLQ